MEVHSRHKSRILREMSRDLNYSVASSTGSNHGTVSADSTMTDFNPEKDEVVMSTRTDLTHTNPRLPKLRDTAKKYGRWAPRQSDFVINTSALDRAFPDFTQGSIDDAIDTESIEVGRGPKTRQRGSSRNPGLDYSDNFDSPIVVGDFQVLRSPHRGQEQVTDPTLKDTKRSNIQKQPATQQHRTISQKENLPPSTEKSITGSPYISNASIASGGQRRSLAELHAYVADESNGSITLDSRPAHRSFQAKNTRFSNQTKMSQIAALSKKQHLNEALAGKLRASSGTPYKGPAKKSLAFSTTATNTPNPTQQSFILPATTDISHVVSTEAGSGIPVVVRGGVVQSRPTNGFSGKFPFEDVDGIEVPEEEEDIYLSVDLLKSRVAQLEMEKADSQRTINELKRENYQLQAEKQELERRRRSDSALGMADGGSDTYSDRDRNIIADKTKLQAHAASLQSSLDASQQKISNQELRLKANTVERDHAVRQFAQAQILIGELKAENEELKQKNDSLQLHLKDFVADIDEDARSWRTGEEALKREVVSLETKLAKLAAQIEENARNWAKKESSLRRKIRRQDEVLREVQEATQEIRSNTHELEILTTARKVPAEARSANRKRKSETKSVNENASDGGHRAAELPLRPRSRQNINEDAKCPQTDSKSINPEVSCNEESTAGTTIQRPNCDTTNPDGSTLDGSEYESIVGPDFMANLRQLLRESRTMKREAQEAIATGQDNTNHTVQSTRSGGSSHAGLVKGPTSILKNGGMQNRDDFDLTDRLSIRSMRSNIRVDEDHNGRSGASHNRRYSDSATHASTRRRNKMDDMTSEFIIPDIASNIHNHGIEYPALSTSARRIFDGLCKHDFRNCTVCVRVVSFDNTDGQKSKVHISKPVPVSDRLPATSPHEDELTIRPSVQPGLALATVIKSLKDEVAHLKVEHARIQSAYHQHDSSLGMRQRKALKKRLDELLQTIDVRSDQIYALYDVLEGQKQSGQQMSEEDVEVTLLSIGVNLGEFTTRTKTGDKKTTQEQNNNGRGDVVDDSEMDLPWEGIEDTTTGSIGGKRRHAFV